MWTTEVWLKFWCDGHFGWCWTAKTKNVGLLEVFLKQRIEAEVGTKLGKIIHIGKGDVVAMLINHTSAHKLHLLAEG